MYINYFVPQNVRSIIAQQCRRSIWHCMDQRKCDMIGIACNVTILGRLRSALGMWMLNCRILQFLHFSVTVSLKFYTSHDCEQEQYVVFFKRVSFYFRGHSKVPATDPLEDRIYMRTFSYSTTRHTKAYMCELQKVPKTC